ncbi:MAG: LamG domain-containing protein, partial [Candidatus Omnitrophica bacterium]|nr:LamG domain-containing protein [Candidatus Omnitrophota bacterium]
NAEYVNVPSSVSLKPADAVTVEAWVRWDGVADTTMHRVVEKDIGNKNYILWIYGSSNATMADVVGFGINGVDDGGGEYARADSGLSTGEWVHLAGTYDRTETGDTGFLYINGVLQTDTITVTATINQSDNALGIGTGSTGYTWEGQLDEIRVWNVARTQQQIQDNMYKQIDPGSTGLVGYWRLDQGFGQNVPDISGNGNNGTLGATSAVGTDDPRWCAGYVLNPLSGTQSNQVTLDLDGGTYTRYTPAFKVRGWRLPTAPATLSVEGTAKTLGTDYNAAVKPLSMAWRADSLLWHSTLESAGAVTSPDVGSAGTVNSSTFATGRYGMGALFDANSEHIAVSVTEGSDFHKAGGVVEFWYKPDHDHTDNNYHAYFSFEYDNPNRICLYKHSNNSMIWQLNQGGTSVNLSVGSTDYSYSAGEWVHFRAEWDDSLPLASQQRFYVNGVEVVHTDSGTDLNSSSMTTPTVLYIGNHTSTGAEEANGVIDEFRVYGGSSIDPTQIARGGADVYPSPAFYCAMESATEVSFPDIGVAGGSVTNATFTTGYKGSGMLCDSDGEYAAIPMAGNLDPQTGTIEFWYRCTGDPSGTARFFSSSEGDDEFKLDRYSDDYLIGFEINNEGGEQWTVNTNVFDQSWHHLRVTYDTVNDSYYLYIDGVSQGPLSGAAFSDITVTGNNLGIGGKIFDGTRRCGGIIDDFRIYDRVLPPDSDPLVTDYLSRGGVNDTLDITGVDTSGRGDYLYFASDTKFTGMNVELATAGTGTVEVIWEYWNGSDWSALGVGESVEGVSEFKASGALHWNEPADWERYSVNGSGSMYYVRCHMANGDSYTVDPVEDTILTDVMVLQYLTDVSADSTTFEVVPAGGGSTGESAGATLFEGVSLDGINVD